MFGNGKKKMAAEPRTSRAWMVFVALSIMVAPAWSTTITIGERVLQVPEGFSVELAAGPPLVERPIAMARDEQGRLYVTDSAGMTDDAEKQLASLPHRIFRLEDKNGDGVYDHRTLFADRMMFPEGCLWYNGSLYVAAPPKIWKLTDTNNDGQADQREVWFDGKTLTGCANDLHGPYLGHDGWIYWCKGAFAEQRYTLPNGKPFVTRASHIFRARPNGSGLEPVLTGGMDNPVNVAFLSSGERILSCTFFQFPEAGKRDGLIHAIYGGVYGKRHDAIEEHPRTGEVMPVLTHMGAAAPCGLIAGGEQLFGDGYHDQLFACYFNLHKVMRHELVPEGATFSTRDHDFLSCDHADFHPTDVFEDADGSLLVADTGGWYKVCCPTSQLAKPEVLGAIYRVRRLGQKSVEDGLGQKLSWTNVSARELAARLHDPRPFVRRRATSVLRQGGEDAVAALRKILEQHPEAAVRRRAVWTLAGMAEDSARIAGCLALGDRDLTTRQAALHAVGLWRFTRPYCRVLSLAARGEPAEARVAAETLGRLGRSSTVPVLFGALEKLGPVIPDDTGAPREPDLRVREHAFLYALIEIGNRGQTVHGLKHPSPQVRRAALLALDQMTDGNLQPETVLAALADSDEMVRFTAAWIISRRPEWGAALADYFRQRLTQPLTNEADYTGIRRQLARLAKAPDIQKLLVDQWRTAKEEKLRHVLLQAMSEATLVTTPNSWLDELARQLPKLPTSHIPTALEAARQWPMPKQGHVPLQNALRQMGMDAKISWPLRLDALVAAGPLANVEPILFDRLLAALQSEDAMGESNAAARILASAKLLPAQQLALAKRLEKVRAYDLPRLLPAFARKPNEALGLELVKALRVAPGRGGLRLDLLQPLLEKYPDSVRQAARPLLNELNATAAQQAAHLDGLLKEVKNGDAKRGHQIFLGKKAACISCHTLGYQGGRLGPDLTNIGKARNERDLLEAMIYPNASLVRGYEPVVLALEDGRVATGIVVHESREELVLAMDARKSQRFARSDIVAIEPSRVSLMPQGIVNVLTKQELADLLAFLRTRSR